MEPQKCEVSHIVILPNYREDEDMLEETLANIGRSSMAKSSIRVVLGMEEREGDEGREKASRLMGKMSHLFLDIFAAYHPAGRQGEVAGKSSNSQWAYREALRHWTGDLVGLDPTRVFISVGDADTLWNPQYFDALAHEGLTRTPEELAWMLWQPPMLLFRNLFAVPGITKLSGFGTLLFELSSLVNQKISPAFVFSSYTLTLALASHRKVAGWDTDVIAEDHHMFLKCFFAPLWETIERNQQEKRQVSTGEPAVSQVRVQPIYLPAEGYLVESSEGYWASCWARFQQARRHMQGVAELSYALQQYILIMRAAKGNTPIPFTTHMKIIAAMWKMAMIHIINNVQATSLLIAAVFAIAGVVAKLSSEGVFETALALFEQGIAGVGATGYPAYETAKMGLFAIFGPAPAVGFISSTAIYIVVRDVIEGRYTRMPRPPLPPPLPMGGGNGGGGGGNGGGGAHANWSASPRTDSRPVAKDELASEQEINLTSWQCCKLALRCQLDMFVLAEPTIVFYGLVPEMMACWSLITKGHEFDYIVAAKPGDSGGPAVREAKLSRSD